MSETAPAYGLRSLVIINSVVFIVLAGSFFKPRNARDWRPCRVWPRRARPNVRTVNKAGALGPAPLPGPSTR